MHKLMYLLALAVTFTLVNTSQAAMNKAKSQAIIIVGGKVTSSPKQIPTKMNWRLWRRGEAVTLNPQPLPPRYRIHQFRR